MNIFATSDCPVKCAKFLDDALIREMTKETARILSAAIKLPTAYRTFDIYHPCIAWARLNRGNFEWLLAHYKALLDEYELRFRTPAKSSHLYAQFKQFRAKVPMGTRSSFVNHSKFKKHTDVHLAYKSDLAYRWISYKKSPSWYNKGANPNKELSDGCDKRVA